MARSFARAIYFLRTAASHLGLESPCGLSRANYVLGAMGIFYVRNSDDNQRLRLYLFLFAEYDGEAEDGWARYRCEPEHEKAFEEYTRRKQVRWG
jgi:hypothetical protein